MDHREFCGRRGLGISLDPRRKEDFDGVHHFLAMKIIDRRVEPTLFHDGMAGFLQPGLGSFIEALFKGLFLTVEIQSLKSADTCLRSQEEFWGIVGRWQPLKLEDEIGLTTCLRVTGSCSGSENCLTLH